MKNIKKMTATLSKKETQIFEKMQYYAAGGGVASNNFLLKSDDKANNLTLSGKTIIEPGAKTEDLTLTGETTFFNSDRLAFKWFVQETSEDGTVQNVERRVLLFDIFNRIQYLTPYGLGSSQFQICFPYFQKEGENPTLESISGSRIGNVCMNIEYEYNNYYDQKESSPPHGYLKFHRFAYFPHGFYFKDENNNSFSSNDIADVIQYFRDHKTDQEVSKIEPQITQSGSGSGNDQPTTPQDSKPTIQSLSASIGLRPMTLNNDDGIMILDETENPPIFVEDEDREIPEAESPTEEIKIPDQGEETIQSYHNIIENAILDLFNRVSKLESDAENSGNILLGSISNVETRLKTVENKTQNIQTNIKVDPYDPSNLKDVINNLEQRLTRIEDQVKNIQ